jgi:uncharacterized membrane protein
MSRFKRPRRYFFGGLALVAPIGATLWVLWWLFRRLDGILGPYLDPVLGRSAPGLGILTLVLALIAVGWLAERTLGRRLTAIWEWTVAHVPVARPVYRGSRRLVEAMVGQDAKAFKEAVLLEYPRRGVWSVAFVTGSTPDDLKDEVGEDGLTVFLPTAPNPMSGFLLVVPREDVRPLAVSTEDAMTFVLSMGSVSLEGRTLRP